MTVFMRGSSSGSATKSRLRLSGRGLFCSPLRRTRSLVSDSEGRVASQALASAAFHASVPSRNASLHGERRRSATTQLDCRNAARRMWLNHLMSFSSGRPGEHSTKYQRRRLQEPGISYGLPSREAWRDAVFPTSADAARQWLTRLAIYLTMPDAT